jgi:hypothetical protein
VDLLEDNDVEEHTASIFVDKLRNVDLPVSPHGVTIQKINIVTFNLRDNLTNK